MEADPWRVSREAEQDLQEIWLYGSARWSPEQAERYYDELLALFGRVSAFPRLGRAVWQKSGRPMRLHPYRAHIVLYRVDEDGVLILRVLAARQDWLALLGDGGV
ncbi:type II toxin-antitoxin system RelE/ParE family toxin [Roseicyclus persicicus]|uniref:Toxin n=1 Tax=Roseicyclus persicicus TaxID=2650661 RepID=A0A7X6GXC4_9RHOB|nr:type II toxin-antitoxin system RelE/ParE family toxin [Roseibacterium persicicum]